MTDSSCPFCKPDSDRVFYQGRHVLGLWDAYPVSPGHALLVPRRHVASWFDASLEEQGELARAIAVARHAIEELHRPDGYNIGVNVGEAAGQTVLHLHVHVIPRYRGDVAEPRGGVRHVVPDKADYTKGWQVVASPWRSVPHGSSLVSGLDDPLLPHLAGHLALADSVDIAVAFTMYQGIRQLQPHLQDVLDRGGRIRYLTGDYLGSTEPAALRLLLDLEGESDGQVERRVFEVGSGPTFHPKAFIFRSSTGESVAFVGSSNVSQAAFGRNVEWNHRVVSSRDTRAFCEVQSAFDRLFCHPATTELTNEWVDDYVARRRFLSLPVAALTEPVEERPEPGEAVVPHVIQERALAALAETRAAGNRAGLVVLATGLGKTWLAALDSRRPEFRRILFVAHREEILRQAMATYRRIRPEAAFGHYTGTERRPEGDVVFASIQTLGRARHLEQYRHDHFDYIVVDEFHHAAARTYRRLIDYFEPKFLLGLTATPERADGGDLLALCQENLVFRSDLQDGIREGLLCPFHYFGIPDEVDYRNIPWRNSRFDEEALTAAVATRSRAENALEQLRKRGGARTLAFCVSQRHADFMAAFLSEQGIRAVAVHSGETSAPRTASLERLEAGELDVVCAVDMFNEGVDLPTLDTVLMLRPTESRVIWLQQFGRGLRTAPGKDHLVVIDYIGNHRTFFLKPQTLLGVEGGRAEVLDALERVQSGEFELPPGCEVTYELEAVNILRALVRTTGIDTLKERYEAFTDLYGVRPTAVEMYHEGYNPRATRPAYGSWLRFVESLGGLDDTQKSVLAGEWGRFLDALEVTEMVRSYKMLTLLAMLNADKFPGEIGIADLAAGFRNLATRSSTLTREAANALTTDEALRRDLERNPIAAWTGGQGTGGVSYFAYENDVLRTTLSAPDELRSALQELAREIADWRLAEYLARPHAGRAGVAGATFQCRVSHAGGRAMIFLPDRSETPGIPHGWTPVKADGDAYEANFVKVAVNVLRKPDTEENVLPALLRRWFGPDAGLPGTANQVAFANRGDYYDLAPAGRRSSGIEVWRRYSREEIPPLFGLEFSRAIWHSGFVAQAGHMFLLVTLEKQGHAETFQYEDRFLSADVFQWQSQNRTTQGSKAGQDVKCHRDRGIAVHLFIRRSKKTAHGVSSPFVYCGDVEFADWNGERPITVRWKLSESIPARLHNELRIEAQ